MKSSCASLRSHFVKRVFADAAPLLALARVETRVRMRGWLAILSSSPATTPPEMRHRVFTTGSLMRGLHNHHLLSSAQLLGAARTAASSYVLVDSGLGFPFAIDAASRETRHPRTALLGECYAVDDATLEKMDVLEGHPDWYRRKQVALEGEDEPAWAYLLIDEETLARAEREMASCADGDWRTRATAEVGWADTKLTLKGDGPFAVFSFGSNGVAQLRERCGNPAITARRAEMREAARVFGGWSTRWTAPSRASRARSTRASAESRTRRRPSSRSSTSSSSATATPTTRTTRPPASTAARTRPS